MGHGQFRISSWQLVLAGMALLDSAGCHASYVKARTQANCACLPTWADENGTAHSGCANPDNDPLGPWCPVSPSSCLGYYSSYTNSSGAAVFYDYCEDIRERTLQGCLCSPEWSMGPGRLGKERYADGCASPEQPGVRLCRIDLATCPESSTAGEFDLCGPGPQPTPPAPPAAAAADALHLTGPADASTNGTSAAAAAAKTATFHGCGCEQWGYEYTDGSRTNFSGCANPDGDPQGGWCAVDPLKCDNFAGEMRVGNQTIAYDYCDKPYRQAPVDVCGVFVERFSQCGGKSNCTGFGCVDAPWPGACCSRGLSCVRQHAFYHQCAAPGDLLLPGAGQGSAGTAAALQAQSDGVVVGGSGGVSVDFIPSAAAGLQSSEDDGQSIVSGSSLAADILSSSSSNLLDPAAAAAAAAAAGQQSLDSSYMPSQAWTQSANAGGAASDSALLPLTPALLPKQPGKKVYTKLKIDTDYDQLISSPLKLSHFKADLVTWLKTVAANPEYIYGAGVDQVLKGSVIALAYVQLTSDAPSEEVAAALARLTANANSSYTTSDLPTDWGRLQSYIVAPSRAELAAGSGSGGGGGGVNGVEEYQAAQTAGLVGGYSRKTVLTAGAIVGISVGGAALVGLMGFVLGRALANDKARRHDADIDAKIRYYDELQEGDLEGLEEEEEEGYEEDEQTQYSDDDGYDNGGAVGGVGSQAGPPRRPGEGVYQGGGDGAAAGSSSSRGWGWWWLRRADSLQHSAEQEMVQQQAVSGGPRSPAHVCNCVKNSVYESDGGSGSGGGAPSAAAAFAAAASLKQRRISMASLSSAGGSSTSAGGSTNYSYFRSSTTGGGAAAAAGLSHLGVGGLPQHLHHQQHHHQGHVAAAAALPLEKDR